MLTILYYVPGIGELLHVRTHFRGAWTYHG